MILAVVVSAGEGRADSQAAARYKGWTVTSLQVTGLDVGLAAELKKGLALAGQKRVIGTRRARLFTGTLQEDLKRTSLFLATHGYPYAQVDVACEPEMKGRNVRVILNVRPGTPVRADTVTVRQVPEALYAPAKSALTVGPGDILRDSEVERSRHLLQDLMQKAGYPFAQVSVRADRVDSGLVALHYEARPGQLCRFGEVIVSGVGDDQVPLVRKTIDVRAGDLYSPTTLQQARINLRTLNLFRQIRIDVQEAEPAVVDVHADLRPRYPRTSEVSFGYWTDDFFRIRARWQHRNLLRAGRGLEVRGAASRFRQEGGVSLWWPALFGSRTRFSNRLQLTRESEESYDLLNTELELAAVYYFSLLSSLRIGAALSDVDVEVETEQAGAFAERGGLLTIFSLRWNRDATDDRIYPTRGTVNSALLEWAPSGFLSDSHFLSLQGASSWYRGYGSKLVVASRLEVGVAYPLGDSPDLLPNKRFFAGGATTMRGAKRRQLGPVDDEGAPLGGEAKLLASAELRFPLYGRLRAAVFIDAGQVWSRREHIDLAELEVAAGPGLMVQTPVGPVRADVAWNLTERPAGEPEAVYHLSIGHPF
jgi:outer membrane protein insertion porin family